MKLSRNILLSWEILMAHRLRTLLSVLGIVVGVGAVVVMVSAGRGAEKQILDRIRNMGTNLVVINAGQTRIIAGRKRQIGSVTTLVPEDAEVIAEQCPSVALAAAASSKKLAVRWESENTNTTVVGMDAAGFGLRNIEIAWGRFFDPEEDRASRRVAVLGPTVIENLFGNNDPVGLRIRIGRVPFEIIGVTRPKGVDIGGLDQDDMIVVPLNTAMRRLINVTYVDTIFVQTHDARMLRRAETEIRELLRKRHRLGHRPDDFTVQNQATLLEAERETARSMTVLVGSVAGISLLVGGVGILAVMLISVRERTREIGLRRAVGACRRDIRTQFLVESGLLAGSGGLLGILGGMLAALGVSALGHWPTLISWPAAVVGLAFSVAVGIAFGIYPAVRAARLEPIAALRAE